MTSKDQAFVEDLYLIPGKAEIVNGKIVRFPPTGALPSRARGSIIVSLRLFESDVPDGRVLGSTTAFIVDLPNCKSFSPDVAFYVGPAAGMKFPSGAPVFAVEVHNENDYSLSAERKISQKIKEYFAAGTTVAWDVHLLSKDVIKVYRSTDPDNPTIYRRGDIAEAEPAVPGWRMAVDDLFN